ncbi:copper resistance CopC family protein [Methylosinus sp. PW1]|uniref:copper resistance CopC family protein n=1 Tax=Methylosinus sp. PW1 TaxID=107636 RepID=UPI000563C18C|nr:copper resistance CopC family protein [Methylosinus sp. PW1]
MILPAAAPDRNPRRTAVTPRCAALLLLGLAICLVSPHAWAQGSQTLAFLAPSQSPPPRVGPPVVRAHAIVVRTSPAQDGVAPGNIGKVDVWYDAGIRDAFAALAVIAASGERVDKRDAAIDRGDPAHVSVGVNPLGPGKYTVRYRALSADGHLVSGAWEFEVRPQ